MVARRDDLGRSRPGHAVRERIGSGDDGGLARPEQIQETGPPAGEGFQTPRVGHHSGPAGRKVFREVAGPDRRIVEENALAEESELRRQGSRLEYGQILTGQAAGVDPRQEIERGGMVPFGQFLKRLQQRGDVEPRPDPSTPEDHGATGESGNDPPGVVGKRLAGDSHRGVDDLFGKAAGQAEIGPRRFPEQASAQESRLLGNGQVDSGAAVQKHPHPQGGTTSPLEQPPSRKSGFRFHPFHGSQAMGIDMEGPPGSHQGNQDPPGKMGRDDDRVGRSDSIQQLLREDRRFDAVFVEFDLVEGDDGNHPVVLCPARHFQGPDRGPQAAGIGQGASPEEPEPSHGGGWRGERHRWAYFIPCLRKK